MQRRWIPALVMIALLVGFRVTGNLFPSVLPNFQPLCALFLCSIACQRGPVAWGIPLAAWIVSSPLASWLNHYSPFTLSGGVAVAFVALLAIGFMAVPLRKHATGPALILSSIAGAVFFHIATNAAVWLADPGYAKSVHGLAQAIWTGRPGEMPTWIFFRNLLAANVIFTALFLLARRAPAYDEERAVPLATTTR
jgi:hypothetical protein